MVRDHSPQFFAIADLLQVSKVYAISSTRMGPLVNGLLDPYSQAEQTEFSKW